MSTINNQVNSLLTVDNFKITPEDSTIPTRTSVTPLLTIDDFKITPKDPNTTSTSLFPEYDNVLDNVVNEYSKTDALMLAASMGLGDTIRGVKQLTGFNVGGMKVDQKILNRLMENSEWGNQVKAAYFGSLLLDPIGFLTPVSKVAQLAKAGYKISKTQKALDLSLHGAMWGGIGGFTGYVDEESSDRLTNTILGIGGGAIIAPALGVSADTLTKFLSSKTYSLWSSIFKEILSFPPLKSFILCTLVGIKAFQALYF